MDLGISGKVAVVTGGARGIGRAVVEEFVREGAKVGILDIWQENLDAAGWVEKHSGEVYAVHTDVSDPDAVNAAFAEIADALGAPAILVSSTAGLTDIARISQMDQERWQRDLSVNLTGVFNCVRAALPYMRERTWGRIVAVSSVAGVQGGFGQAGYSAAKGGVISLMKTVALEAGRDSITANAVYVGIVSTEAFRSMRADIQERIRHRVIWRTEAEPEDIAKPIVFLCSEPARYITGAAWDLTGGIDLFTF
ncbi:MAG: Acetoacetyl-CoA reductase [Anaerolineales bacterium]|nr:Acetoacetyl-CoA reductase [Anaerolineales bacterium]